MLPTSFLFKFVCYLWDCWTGCQIFLLFYLVSYWDLEIQIFHRERKKQHNWIRTVWLGLKQLHFSGKFSFISYWNAFGILCMKNHLSTFLSLVLLLPTHYLMTDQTWPWWRSKFSLAFFCYIFYQSIWGRMWF